MNYTRLSQRQGPNEKCKCGSGLKFKKCCSRLKLEQVTDWSKIETVQVVEAFSDRGETRKIRLAAIIAVPKIRWNVVDADALGVTVMTKKDYLVDEQKKRPEDKPRGVFTLVVGGSWRFDDTDEIGATKMFGESPRINTMQALAAWTAASDLGRRGW